MSKKYSVLASCVLFALCLFGCKGTVPTDQPHQDGNDLTEEINPVTVREIAESEFRPAYRPHFKGIDGTVDADGNYQPLQLDDIEEKGRNAWMLWTGGNERFWDWLSKNGYGSIDLLKVVSLPRNDRFQRAGLINEPGMREPYAGETTDSFGIIYDRPIGSETYDMYGNEAPSAKVYGYPTGIVGMRLFRNPEFKGAAKARWMANMNYTGSADSASGDDAYRNKPSRGTHRFYSDPEYASDPATIKPYIVGLSCAVCHASFHPLNPPTDTAEPEWENISSTIGAQYMRVREVFGNTLQEENYVYHVLDSQLPGTIDTSLIATDNINNSNTMNAVFGLGWRVDRSLYNTPERLSEETFRPVGGATTPGLWDSAIPYDANSNYPSSLEQYYHRFEENPRHVPRVLVDGSDSVGTWLALARVYLNIGTYHQQWQRTHNTILGFKGQDPFRLADCENNSVYWHATKNRVDSITKYFLKSSAPMKLRDAIINNEQVEKFPGLPENFSGDSTDPALQLGRAAFAKGCIACHSSKQPDHKSFERPGYEVKDDQGNVLTAKTLDMDDLWHLVRNGELPDDYEKWAQHAVESPHFWEENYLSTDMRIPVTMTGTNSARSMATNAKSGHVWEDFASNTFKDLASVGAIRYHDPFSGATNEYEAPAGGPGYYRVPTLIGAWATAPFLHNNALGDYNHDPSVKGRLEAFDDAIEKLLWPEKRLDQPHDLAKLDQSQTRSSDELKRDGGLIWRTSRETDFRIHGHQIPVFIKGFTGWTDAFVTWVPHLPSLLFVLVGLTFLLGGRIRRILDSIGARSTSLEITSRAIRIIFSILMVLAGFGLAWSSLKYLGLARIIESGSDWSVPWIQLQIGALVAFLIICGAVLFLNGVNRSIPAGVVCLLAAVLFALGFGRFASGNGGELVVGPFPKGMPVNLVVNMDPHAPRRDMLAAVNALSSHFEKYHNNPGGSQQLEDFEFNVAPALMKVSTCPDLVLDRGHDFQFIQQLSDQEKKSLIQLIKTF